MAPVRELDPAVVRCYSRSGDELGEARLPWPNVAAGDLLELHRGGLARVLDVVAATSGPAGALVKVAPVR